MPPPGLSMSGYHDKIDFLLFTDPYDLISGASEYNHLTHVQFF
jgi:hypothetical protein